MQLNYQSIGEVALLSLYQSTNIVDSKQVESIFKILFVRIVIKSMVCIGKIILYLFIGALIITKSLRVKWICRHFFLLYFWHGTAVVTIIIISAIGLTLISPVLCRFSVRLIAAA